MIPRPDDAVPRLAAGATRLDSPPERPDALRRVAVAAHRRRDGPTYWIDARNTASTHALNERADPTDLTDVRVARAFTGYQHAALTSRLVRRASAATGLVVAAHAASLYRDEDVREHLRGDRDATLSAFGGAR